MSIRLAILLPTYNGELYLAEQLDSLLGQSHDDFIIVIRDDGSTDRTLEIIQSYLNSNPEQIHSLKSNGENLGASAGFSFLMQYVLSHKQELHLEPAYMMFCDQDDVWNQNKVADEISLMQKVETSNTGQPVLVHSDLTVVSESQELISTSFVNYQGLNIEKKTLGQIAISNTVTGCTALINEALANRALPIPGDAVMHDWWLALVAAAFGRIEFVPNALVYYRQHANNTIGARQHDPKKRLNFATAKDFLRSKPSPLFEDIAVQATSFAHRYREHLPYGQRLRLRLVSFLVVRNIFLQRILFRLLRL